MHEATCMCTPPQFSRLGSGFCMIHIGVPDSGLVFSRFGTVNFEKLATLPGSL